MGPEQSAGIGSVCARFRNGGGLCADPRLRKDRRRDFGDGCGRAVYRRRHEGGKRSDALEVFYDFKFLNNLRMGFSLQERNSFSELVAGFRVKTEFDLTPRPK